MSTEKKLDRRALLTTLAAGAAATGLAATAKAEDLRTTVHDGEGEPGGIWWNEYLAQNPDRMNHFYSTVVGWRMKLVSLDEPSRLAEPDEKSYMVMLSQNEEAAGVMRLQDAEFGARPGWFTYIQVDDADVAARRAVQLGGRIVREPVDSDENMRIAVIQDPEGCLVGLASKRRA
jgi:predicted enzyme related to lactoylglutathione lyase